MKSTELTHIPKIQITFKNCDEIIAESFEILKQATKLKTIRDFEQMRSEALSRQIKRGLRAKREREQEYARLRGESK